MKHVKYNFVARAYPVLIIIGAVIIIDGVRGQELAEDGDLVMECPGAVVDADRYQDQFVYTAVLILFLPEVLRCVI